MIFSLYEAHLIHCVQSQIIGYFWSMKILTRIIQVLFEWDILGGGVSGSRACFPQGVRHRFGPFFLQGNCPFVFLFRSWSAIFHYFKIAPLEFLFLSYRFPLLGGNWDLHTLFFPVEVRAVFSASFELLFCPKFLSSLSSSLFFWAECLESHSHSKACWVHHIVLSF
jgi:hypothetical protein